MARAASQALRGLPALPAVTVALLRRLRVELPLVASVVAMVLVTSLVFAAVPRVFSAMSEAGLRSSVAGAAVYQRDLVAGMGGRLETGAGGDVSTVVDAAGARFQQSLAPSIRSLIDHRTFVVDSVRYVFPAEAFKHLTVRYQSGVERHVRVVAGRLPAPTTATIPPGPGGTVATPVLEVAMSPETAQALGLSLGQRVVLEPDPTDRLILPRGGPPPDLAFQVVGLIESLRPDDDYWYADPRLQTPSVSDAFNTTQIYGIALFAAAAYPDLLRDTGPALVQYSWRYFVDPARFQSNQAGQLADDLHRLEATYGSPLSSAVADVGVSTGLTGILAGYDRQRGLTASTLSLLAIGLLAISLAVIGLVAAFVAERRREGIALVRGRGGSPAQLLAAQTVEGVLLCLPAALTGYLLALAFVRAEPSDWSLYAALGVAVLTAFLLVATALPWMRRHLGGFEREAAGRQRFSPRRAALDAFVVALAGAGVFLLQQRGLAGAGAPFDPYLAAAPALLGLATGLVVLRLSVLPVRLLARRASSRRDLVLFLGLRRVSRRSSLTAVPLLVLLLAVAVGVFGSNMATTIEVGQVQSSWERVGADYRVDPPPGGGQGLDPGLDLSKVPGVQAAASAYRQDLGSVSLFAVQPAAYERVTAGTPVDVHMPPALLASRPARDSGARRNPIPAIVSRVSPAGAALRPGDAFSLQPEDRPLTFVVSEVRDGFAGLPAGRPFVVVPLGALDAAEPEDPPVRSQLYLRAPPGALPAIRGALQQRYAGGLLTSRAQEYAQVHDAPLVAGAVSGLRAGVVTAAVSATLAVVVALALAGRVRTRDLGYLRTLGLSPRQVIGLMAVEQTPPAVLALVVGTGLGVAITRLVAPGLDLTPFTGPGVVALQVDWPAVTLLVGGLLAAVAAAAAAVGLLSRRTNLAGVLRWEDR